MFTYSDVLLKLIVGFLFITILINVTGKGNLAPTSAMDQLQNYVLGGIIGGVIYNPAITMAQFLVILLLWALLIMVTRYLKTHIHWFGKFIEGEPITIVRNGKMLVENCLKANLSAKDVDFKLRTAGVYDISQVKRAIVEQNGSLTVLNQGEGSIRYPVIVDGQVDPDVLDLMEKDENWLAAELKKQKIDSIRDVYWATYRDGQLTVAKFASKS
ncbi:DUF421 domain-containing protein [Lentilactobacillus kisonensis]|uniref:DUF421 domain-containing protein n=1 Tax=Lentilactobacillus kisonensis DSM 19906 = JCM 15041 TaxID=1423766 RepID=A0A0R1NR84_9LACO|nr:DUF421 domain-containing protein [Lentilactobacillus kisonensis]KRL22862.1 hypothetical protein FC98_GL001612 [Lentilactobacillus kisonensis DSM 19906 = JCM 15041]